MIGTLSRLAPAIALAVAGATAVCPTPAAWGAESTWLSPTLDIWGYAPGGNPGQRPTASTFGFLVDLETNEPAPGGDSSPGRLSSFVFAFETSSSPDSGDAIPTGLDPTRYLINAATVTMRQQLGSGGSLIYEDRPLSELDVITNGVPEQLPVELFGAGFNSGVDGFAAGVNQGLVGNFVDESRSLFIGPDGAYGVFPAIGDGSGGLIDVANNLTGGYSATSPTGETDPFDAIPWAVGSVPGLSRGDAIPGDTTFDFDIDLTQPGVVGYLQESLAEGVVGFVLSTIHAGGQFGTGGAPFPQWYTKEGVQLFEDFSIPTFAGAEAATLVLDVTIADELMPGDYDRSGTVDAADYLLWRSTFGDPVAMAGDGADGNGDGAVNAADYVVWRDALPVPAAPLAIAAPEPSLAALAVVGLAILGCCRVSGRH
ncbi:MAG: dockerin type I domain-containing protein [Planctomycetota bacterium]